MKPFLFFELAIGPRRKLLVLQLVSWVGHYVGAFFNSFFPSNTSFVPPCIRKQQFAVRHLILLNFDPLY